MRMSAAVVRPKEERRSYAAHWREKLQPFLPYTCLSYVIQKSSAGIIVTSYAGPVRVRAVFCDGRADVVMFLVPVWTWRQKYGKHTWDAWDIWAAKGGGDLR